MIRGGTGTQTSFSRTHWALRQCLAHFLAAWILLLVGLSSSEAALSAGCASRIPVAVADFLLRTVPTWRITDVSDLSSDDLPLWKRVGGQACPGFVAGHFLDKAKLTYAVLLIRIDGRTVQQRLIVLEQERATFKYWVLSEKAWERVAGGRVFIIGRVGPGRHWDAERSFAIETRLDSIVLEALEAGAVMFYWRNGDFGSLNIQI